MIDVNGERKRREDGNGRERENGVDEGGGVSRRKSKGAREVEQRARQYVVDVGE